MIATVLAAYNEYVSALARPVERALGLTKLSEHAPLAVGSALGFWALHIGLAPVLSALLCPESYARQRTRRARNNWNSHIVSLAHALLVTPLSMRYLSIPALNADHAFGWDARAGTLGAIALGYFTWDSFESIVHFQDVGFVVHGLACFAIYLLQFKPFIAYYGPRFLLWELSTPLLNIHWFLDKMGRTGSTLQLINGILLLSTFAGVRLVYGTYQSFSFYRTMYTVYGMPGAVPRPILLAYGVGNVILNGLNWVWFYKMIAALRKRMRPDAKNSSAVANGKREAANGDGNHNEKKER